MGCIYIFKLRFVFFGTALLFSTGLILQAQSSKWEWVVWSPLITSPGLSPPPRLGKARSFLPKSTAISRKSNRITQSALRTIVPIPTETALKAATKFAVDAFVRASMTIFSEVKAAIVKRNMKTKSRTVTRMYSELKSGRI